MVSSSGLSVVATAMLGAVAVGLAAEHAHRVVRSDSLLAIAIIFLFYLACVSLPKFLLHPMLSFSILFDETRTY
jgi:small neutral amino acid transporter SnatA (MarC family)